MQRHFNHNIHRMAGSARAGQSGQEVDYGPPAVRDPVQIAIVPDDHVHTSRFAGQLLAHWHLSLTLTGNLLALACVRPGLCIIFFLARTGEAFAL